MMQGSQEENMRRETIMREVMPDNQMWEEWEKKEAPARKGRGWFPSLDRRFLELLVATEIDMLSLEHDVQPIVPLERSVRSRDKIRRVAQIRIGRERLEAYCGRVAQAFSEYVQGSISWNEGSDANADAESICVVNASGLRDTEDEEEEGYRAIREKSVRGRPGRSKSLTTEDSADQVDSDLRSASPRRTSSKGKSTTANKSTPKQIEQDTDAMAVDEVCTVEVKVERTKTAGAEAGVAQTQ